LALLSKADVVVSAAGTSAAELLFLEVPTIFVPVAENQAENAASLERLGLAPVVRPGSTAFEEDLLKALDFTLRRSSASLQTKRLVDGHAALRIAEVMLHKRV
jgi:UDP-N-acetylglucosamine:LPS N-acetylglucosamine transferase